MSADKPDQDAIQWEEARRWFARADEDLAVAGLALEAVPPILAAAAFHCQQTAEKLLKGLLIAARLTAPKTHDLARLAPSVAAKFPTIAHRALAFRPLTSWFLVGRYPDAEAAVPCRPDIEAALKDLQEFWVRVRELDPYRR